MSDTVIVALLVALAPTILAISTLVVSIRNGKKSDVIKEHVNSTATKQQEKIDRLTAQVEALIADKAEKKETAALLAQAIVERAEPRGEI